MEREADSSTGIVTGELTGIDTEPTLPADTWALVDAGRGVEIFTAEEHAFFEQAAAIEAGDQCPEDAPPVGARRWVPRSAPLAAMVQLGLAVLLWARWSR